MFCNTHIVLTSPDSFTLSTNHQLLYVHLSWAGFQANYLAGCLLVLVTMVTLPVLLCWRELPVEFGGLGSFEVKVSTSLLLSIAPQSFQCYLHWRINNRKIVRNRPRDAIPTIERHIQQNSSLPTLLQNTTPAYSEKRASKLSRINA